MISSFFLCAIFLTSCSNLSILSLPTATPTPTLTPTITPTNTPVPTSTPKPTVTPRSTFTIEPYSTVLPTSTVTRRSTLTIEPYSNVFPKDWGLEPLSNDQIQQVISCDVEKLATERYPEKDKTDELIYLLEPETPCDWAVLAFAYAKRTDDNEKLPDVAKNAFAQAISINPGFVFSTSLFYRFFFESFPIVNQPPLSKQEITTIRIEYNWEGMGDPVEYKVDILQANTNPIVKVINSNTTTAMNNLKTKVDKTSVQALGKSFSNLIPIKSQFSLVPCTDNGPDWTITITQKDGTSLNVKTNGSNMIIIGGPWQTNIDGQDYLQFSIEFIAALDKVIREIGLPYGQPNAMFCAPESVLDKAFP